MNDTIQTIAIVAFLICILRFLTKIKIQNKEVFPKNKRDKQFEYIFILILFLFCSGFFYREFLIDKRWLASQKIGVAWLFFSILGANIIYLLYEIRNKNLNALVRYIIVALSLLVASCAFMLVMLSGA